jgi:hypothetical protein
MRVVFPVGSQQTVSKDTTNTSTKVSQRAVSGRIYAKQQTSGCGGRYRSQGVASSRKVSKLSDGVSEGLAYCRR